MTDKNGKSQDVTAVGSRVRIAVSDSDGGGSVTFPGVVIEDYADMVIDRGSVGGTGLRCIGGPSHSTTSVWSSRTTKT